MNLIVNRMGGGTLEIKAEPNQTVCYLRQRIYEMIKVLPEHQALFHRGKKIYDTESLE